MQNSGIIKILKQVAERLKEKNFSFSAIYLFGSYAKNKATKWSDIDVAVISDKFKNDHAANWLSLSKLAKDIDVRIEPHGFTRKDFENLNDPTVYEIRTTGIKII
jgi:predicted nucleotidyltransferase